MPQRAAYLRLVTRIQSRSTARVPLALVANRQTREVVLVAHELRLRFSPEQTLELAADLVKAAHDAQGEPPP